MSLDRALVHGILRAAVGVAAVAGVVAAAAQVPTTDLQDETTSTAPASARAVTASSLVCPGPELSGIEGIDAREVPAQMGLAVPPADLLATVLDRELGREPAGGEGTASIGRANGQGALTVSRQGSVARDELPGSSVVADATGSLAPGLVAVQQAQAVDGDEFGLSSVACGAPAADQWLLAGGGDAGRQERLLLTNPSGNPVTVDVSLHGEDGEVDSPVGKGVVVPAQGRTGLLLDSISATEDSPAVHVVATGGRVNAVLNDLWVDGTRGAGTDDVPRSAGPATDLVLSGIASRNATVRVAVPGTREAVLQLQALTASGPRALGSRSVVRAAGGAVVDTPLTDLPDGTYAVRVTSDVPVVASAVTVSHQPGDVGDLAWTTATEPVRALAGLPLLEVDGDTSRLLTLATTDAAATVEVVTVDADRRATRRTVELPAGASVPTSLPASALAVWVAPTDDAGAVHAAVITVARGDEGVAVTSTPLRDAPLSSQPVELVASGNR